MNRVTVGFIVSTMLVACTQGTSDTDIQAKLAAQTSELERLRAQVQELQVENAELRTTPAALLRDVDAAVVKNNEADAQAALARLIDRYPASPEAGLGKKQVDDLLKSNKAKADEAARLAAQGFKALKVGSTFAGDQSQITVRAASIGSNWTFDAYGDEWHYQEPEKGRRFVTAKASVSSENKNPSLVGVGIYVADGNTLKRLGILNYRFARWDDYGSYLGNYADYRNDFAHTNTIPFSMGVEVDADAIKRPVYFIATKQGCFDRMESRFGNPPVSYYATSCDALAPSLTVSDFADGKLGVLKRLD